MVGGAWGGAWLVVGGGGGVGAGWWVVGGGGGGGGGLGCRVGGVGGLFCVVGGVVLLGVVCVMGCGVGGCESAGGVVASLWVACGIKVRTGARVTGLVG